MRYDKETGSEVFVLFVLGLLVTPFLALWRGFVIVMMWEWFIVASFEVPGITVFAAAGLSFLIAMLVYTPQPKGKTEVEIFSDGVSAGVIIPAFVLFWGWIFSLFM